MVTRRAGPELTVEHLADKHFVDRIYTYMCGTGGSWSLFQNALVYGELALEPRSAGCVAAGEVLAAPARPGDPATPGAAGGHTLICLCTSK